ncbi:MAG: phospholipid/cholesterol/gamma-HCH transport system substrate-binding protein [Solirubrobacteraceae bacterium]|nr:phospholipid/cholesterol/gamma-HCH transport system substrate-binding protein [Solirubrobacteraceae bacterium]
MSGIRDRMNHKLTRDRVRLEVQRAGRPFLIVVAVSALAVVSLLVLLVRLHINLPWQDKYEVRVAVDDAKGVAAGSNEVRISGVVVGKIVKVSLQDGKAVLTARIEPKYAPLYNDARLRLRPKTPLEDMYLNVDDRGTAAAGRVANGGFLTAEHTGIPVKIGAVLDIFQPDVRTRVAETIDSLGTALGDHGDDLRATLTELAPFLQAAQNFSAETAKRADITRRLVHNFALLNEELARRSNAVEGVVTRGSGVVTELASVDAELGATLDELPPTLRQLPITFTQLRTTAGALEHAAVTLRPAAQALPDGLRAIEAFAPDLQAGAAALRRPLPSLNRLVRALPPLASNLNASFATLRPQAPRLNRVTAAVVPCELAVSKFFQWTISVAKYYGVRGAVLRGDPVVGGTTAAGGAQDLGTTSKPDCAAGGPRN